jgi:hypothetical protein
LQAWRLAAIQVIDKLTFCLEGIKYCSSTNDPNLMGTIYVVASEILKEVTPEIEAIKSSEMDKDRPGDLVSG